jgi:hypothetical protein
MSDTQGIWVLGGSRLTTTNGHACLCLDADGSDVLIWTSKDDNGVYKVPIDGRPKTLLMRPPWAVAVDISAPAQGDPIISTYSLNLAYPGQVLKAALDGSGVEVLCETGSIQIPLKSGNWAYNPQPKASVSRDGSKVVFCSNFGRTEDPNYCDVALLTVENSRLQTDPELSVNTLTDTIISYDQYMGKSEFIIKPQHTCPTCGSTVKGIFERKLK